jgi:hypothetical protein
VGNTVRHSEAINGSCSQVFRLLLIVIDVISGVLRNREFIAILQTKQGDDAESKSIDEYFQRLLLK